MVFVLGLGSFYLGQKLDMAILQTHAKWLFTLAWVRILTFDVLVLNPIWSNAHVYGIVPINTLCITYLLPIFFTTQSLTRSVFDSKRAGILHTFSFVLFFMWITTNIRFFFHPDAMMRGTTSHIEIYTYSIAYLLVSIGLLVYGLAEKHKGIRKASIALMTLTVSKVFLYDASNLTGMYRVLSFLGLGICLLTISFIYSKFIFKEET
ncbi:MAG: DUF2339 domain-containing protein [Bdellovibrionota bacterium]